MPIQVDRIRRDIEAIAACTATRGAGASRATFSPHWREACDYVRAELEACCCEVRVDCCGNIRARPLALGWDVPAWLSGSHLDSVPGGGDYDGVAGVVAPLAVLRSAHEEGIADLPLELIVFADEEGTTFGLGMLGSRALVGELSAEQLAAVQNEEGLSYLEAGAPCGVRPEAIGQEILRPDLVRGFIEIHPEQGPGLWSAGHPLAIVTGIAGRRQLRARLAGRANHAGSTAMGDRHDALAAAAEAILALEALAPQLSAATVITVGQIVCWPNAINVIPGEVEFSIDFRSPDDEILREGERRIEALVHQTVASRGVSAEVVVTESVDATVLDASLCERLQAAASRVIAGLVPECASGALHDAAILAPHVPTAMLFVASREGVSHNPEEFSRAEDIALAAEVLMGMIRDA